MEEELRLGRTTSEATGACLVRQRLTSREHSPVRQYVGAASWTVAMSLYLTWIGEGLPRLLLILPAW